jgi:hypothetical protein
MVGYRLYYLNNDRHIVRAAEFECADDAEALLWAEEQRDEHLMELSGKRVSRSFLHGSTYRRRNRGGAPREAQLPELLVSPCERPCPRGDP